MSADTLTPAAVHDEHGDSAPHGTLRGYLIGFVLSVVLTAIPFALVMSGYLDPTSTAIIVLGMALVQIVVHMVFFLHMTTRAEGGWSFLALMFTLVVVIVTLAGSIWVMYHMNANMMPMSPAAMSQQ